MVTKIHRDALRSDIASVQGLLERARGRDPLGEISLGARLRELEVQLRALEQAVPVTANVALVFDGAPVWGGRPLSTPTSLDRHSKITRN